MKKQSSPGSKANAVSDQQSTTQQRSASKKAQATAKTEIINTSAPGANSMAYDNGAANQSDQDASCDDEDSAVLLRMESEVSLPRAPVKQLIMEKLPEQARIHQQSKELISSLCMHFLSHLAEQSNEFCSAQNKKTVCPDHVLDALTKMNLTRYFPQLAALDPEQLKQQASAQTAKSKPGTKKRGKAAAAQAQAAQENEQSMIYSQRMRQAILTRLNQSMKDSKSRPGKSGANQNDQVEDNLTAQQRNLEQENLFREAREQYEKQQLANQQAAVEQPSSQYQPIPDGQDYNGVGGDSPMDNMPPFNPTDYFRDMIYMTDFMVEQDPDFNGYRGMQEDVAMQAPGQQPPMDVTPIDQIVNEEDAEMADEDAAIQQEAQPVAVIPPEEPRPNQEAVEAPVPQSLMMEGFSFDEEELEALQAFNQAKVANGDAGASAHSKASMVANEENNTKSNLEQSSGRQQVSASPQHN